MMSLKGRASRPHHRDPDQSFVVLHERKSAKPAYRVMEVVTDSLRHVKAA